MSIIVHRVSPQAARYTPAGGRERCGACRFYVSPRFCGKVIGPVSPMGWCKYFSQQMVSQFGGSIVTSGIPAGATLALDFMSSGNLPAGVTFSRASTATYTDASGVIQTAAVNAPRWDYAGGVLRGLLIEEQRTNLLFPSIIGGAPWASINGLTLGGSTVVPDGTTSTSALMFATDTATTARLFYRPGTAITASTAYVVSVYLKASPKNAYIQVDFSGGTTNVGMAYFDLTAGTGVVGADLGGSVTGKSVAIVPAGSGWYRCSFALTTGVGNTSMQVAIGPCTVVSSSGDNRNYVGVVGQGVYAWGADVQQGAFPTSHIPTTSVSVTRAADVATMPTNVSWFSATTGTIMSEALSFGSSVAGAFNTTTSLNDGSAANRIETVRNDMSNAVSEYLVISGAFTSANVGSAGPNTLFKAVMSYAAGSQRGTLNGAAVTAIGTSAVLPPVTQMTIGSVVNAQFLNGYMRRVLYWPRVLSDTEMRQVTT